MTQTGFSPSCQQDCACLDYGLPVYATEREQIFKAPNLKEFLIVASKKPTQEQRSAGVDWPLHVAVKCASRTSQIQAYLFLISCW